MRHGFVVSLVCLVAACAAPVDIERQPVAARFESALSAKMLAGCIDANGRKLGWTPGIYSSKISDTGNEPIVVTVEDTANNHPVAMVNVVTRAQGSAAEFRFEGLGVAAGTSLRRLTAGCE